MQIAIQSYHYKILISFTRDVSIEASFFMRKFIKKLKITSHIFVTLNNYIEFIWMVSPTNDF